jgi:hypothetical protein
VNRSWSAAALLLLLTITGCGVQPSGVAHDGEPPTGLAPGVTLYFVDEHGQLQPDLRRTGRLGTITEAISLLMTGPGQSDLRTEIALDVPPRAVVTTTPETIEIMVPLTVDDVTPTGIDQIVCTALGVHVQSGGSTDTTVQVHFVQHTPESDELRTCPLFG